MPDCSEVEKDGGIHQGRASGLKVRPPRPSFIQGKTSHTSPEGVPNDVGGRNWVVGNGKLFTPKMMAHHFPYTTPFGDLAVLRTFSGLSLIVLCLGIFLITSGCATGDPPRTYILEDGQGRYYETHTGRFLRVAPDGVVYDITCAQAKTQQGGLILPEQRGGFFNVSDCNEMGWVVRLGQVTRANDDWDLAGYNVAPETGTCKPLFLMGSKLVRGRFSCWNRLWEIPLGIITIGIAGAGMLAGGG